MKNSQKEMELIKSSVAELYSAQLQKKKSEEYYNAVKKKEQLAISNFMFCCLPKDQKSFEVTLDSGIDFYENHTKLLVTNVVRKTIKWNIEKLKEVLNKATKAKVINKTYTVNDMQGLVEYLKTCGVNPKKFKQFIDVEETLNESVLDNMYETGQIKKEQLAGCYETKVGEPYIRLTEKK